MSLSIAQNAQFDLFVEFARQQMKAGHTRAVARAGAATGATLDERAISAAASGDRAFAVVRSGVSKTANDVARDLFRKSVAEIFGGERKIPDSVKRAMMLKDYGSGKPLTARRILAVQEAIAEAESADPERAPGKPRPVPGAAKRPRA